MGFQTEYEFLLPKGYLDREGKMHCHGKMRLARAEDEIQAYKHPKVRENPEYATLVVISKVITELEGCNEITLEMLENFYLQDINFLQTMYQKINEQETVNVHLVCPHCGKEFTEILNFTDME